MGLEQYLENEVMTATPGKLVLMLYEGAIRFLKQVMAGEKLPHAYLF